MTGKPGTAWLAAMFFVLLLAVVVGGCGGGSSSAGKSTASTNARTSKGTEGSAKASESTPKPESEATESEPNLKVSIPGGLTSANTCKGKNSSPAISWSKVPPGTEEIAVFAVNVKPVKGTLYFDWALAGINPKVTHLKAGEVPGDAVLGKTGSGAMGWSLCPRGPKPENYIFSVYALSKSLSPKEGFNPLQMRIKATPLQKKVGLEGVSYPG
jgi:phosphatidylethanolamine-binding protein (PEBP) family uncharacterized protein